MNKVSSYKKLKKENDKLKNDIYDIVRNSDKEIGIITKMRYEIMFDLYDNMFLGSYTNQTVFDGLLTAMQK